MLFLSDREFGPGGKPGSRQFWAIGRFQGGQKVANHWKWNLVRTTCFSRKIF